MNMQIATHQPVKRQSSTILQRISETDKSAVEDCINTYGNLIWALGRRFTNSTEEAEEATLKIFNDIWNYAAQYDSAKCTEEKYVLKIAIRRLIKLSNTKKLSESRIQNYSENEIDYKVVAKTDQFA